VTPISIGAPSLVRTAILYHPAEPSPAADDERTHSLPRIVTDLIELAVGLGCLAGVPAAWRRGMRWLAGLFAVAGLAAAVHAVVSMAT